MIDSVSSSSPFPGSVSEPVWVPLLSNRTTQPETLTSPLVWFVIDVM
jgi:hypothetical protein